MNFFVERSGLRDLYDKVAAGERISETDALRLFESKDLNALGAIADLARHFADGSIHARNWPDMDDEAVIAELIQVRGIGRWTAEMFLMFNLLRPDVLPLDDLGLQKAICLYYFDGARPAREQMRELAANWAPWRSVATWYLWRSLDPVPVEY